ncbi:MAG: helix-turn-helix transcriptional regulator [Pseudomonadota bacterium]|nr:MAG: transcriptional regulator [Pseudomonadota bacterium]
MTYGLHFRNTLRDHRARLGLTQEELAQLVGVTRKTINTVENGRFVPSTILALKLAKALGTTVEELFLLEPRTFTARPGRSRPRPAARW